LKEKTMAHILLVEDDFNLRSVLAEILEDAGHRVSALTDGKAVEKCMSIDPGDLVIMDIILPEQDGIETINNLRRNYPDVKIIGMSGGGQTGSIGAEHYLNAALTFGAHDALQKPFEHTELLDKINAVLKETKPAHKVESE
jgi:DNA-binding response OmpR family regulator